MTATSVARAINCKSPGRLQEFLCADSLTFPHGTLAMLDSAGKLRPAAALAGNKGCVGVIELSGGANAAAVASGTGGATYLNVREGIFRFAAGTLEQEDVGSLMWALDNQTFNETAPAASVGQCPALGPLTRYVGASEGDVNVSWQNMQQEVETLLWAGYIPLDTVINGDIVTGLVPGFAGILTRLSFTTFIVDSTGGDRVDLNIEIGTTDCTGTISLTSAELAAVGEIVTTGLTVGVYFGPSDTVSIEAASVTDMVTPTGNVQLYGKKLIK